MSSKLSRRNFLKSAAIGTVAAASAGALAGCSTEASSELPEKWDKEADVVVVGYGGAGAAATLEATKAGSSVVLLERMATGGGSTAICGGLIYMGGGTPLQKALGIEDTRDDMYNYIFNASGNGVDPEFVSILCDQSLELYAWLTEMGLEFQQSFFDGEGPPPNEDGLCWSGSEKNAKYAAVATPAPRAHHAPAPGLSGPALFAPIKTAVEASGAEILFESPAKKLVTNSDGRVVGVIAEVEGKETYIKANKAVVLSAGGYGANKDMVAQHCPQYMDCAWLIGTQGDDGRGIKMAQAVGADTRCLGEAFSYVAAYAPVDCLQKGIIVNAKGQRFVAENNYGEFVGDPIASRNPVAFQIFDSTVWEEIPAEEQEGITLAAQADDIPSLAAALGIPPALLENTMALYNEYAVNGEDPMFEKISEFVTPLQTPPFYALNKSVEGSAFFTTGGLRINPSARVLDTEGEPVPGLYSAGRNAAAVSAHYYVASGVSVAEVLTFGRIAGQNAAAEQPWE